jgi:hypothetical protein
MRIGANLMGFMLVAPETALLYLGLTMYRNQDKAAIGRSRNFTCARSWHAQGAGSYSLVDYSISVQ